MKNDPNIINHARTLSRNMTEQEKKLWYRFLRSYDPPFRRQFVKDGYILDFYCSKARVAIELDGGQHYSEEGLEYDKKRREYLESKNIEVIRYTNADIDRRFKAVCEDIDGKIRKK